MVLNIPAIYYTINPRVEGYFSSKNFALHTFARFGLSIVGFAGFCGD